MNLKEILPWKTEIIKGDPIQVGERQLIPVVKMRSLIRRQVTFGTESSNGGGGGVVWLQPVAVIERQDDGPDLRVPISAETGTAIKGMLIGALSLPALYLFCASVAFVWRRLRARDAVA